MPLPKPKLACEVDRVFADGMEESGGGEWEARGVKDAGTDV